MNKICAFDIKGTQCLIVYDNNKKYCDQCKFRCTTHKDLERRFETISANDDVQKRRMKVYDKLKLNLTAQLKEKGYL